ncbi:hypothetical protein [Acaryochloris marina]|uniref:hypothetical protein n=1 Tax=Acaryochloris marina TaxID=155978 RepID=UPI0005A18ED4|nr:hypothetical protein [Acaryochloris marina]
MPKAIRIDTSVNHKAKASFSPPKIENFAKTLDEAKNLCEIWYYKRSISSALDRNLQMKRRQTSANLHRPSQRPVVDVAMQFGFEALTRIVCSLSEGKNWETILGGLYPDPIIQSGRCAQAPT